MSGATSAVAIGASVAGAAMSAASSISQGNAAAAAAGQNARMSEYQAQVARNNQIIANQNAEHEAEVGMEQAGRKSQEGAAVGAKIKAATAANGIDPNSGSAARVAQSQREIAKLDTETVLNNSQQKVYGYRAQAANFGGQAGLDTEQENLQWNQVGSDISGGYLKAGGTLLSSASSIIGGSGGGGGGDANAIATLSAGGGTAP
jgi:hypothetical protein